MSQRDDHWEPEDEDVVGRLRDGRPRISAFELDGIKTRVMARVRPSASRRATPRLSMLVALLTFGAMVAGTAGTIAAGNSSLSSGTGAAQSQYRPPKCNPRHEECTCPGGSDRVSRDRCVCPSGLTFAAGTNDCRCPNGTSPSDAGRCVKCPDGGTIEGGRCVCPNGGHEENGKCVTRKPVPTPSTLPVTAAPTASSGTAALTSASTSAPAATTVGSTSNTAATVGTTHVRTTHRSHSRTRHSHSRNRSSAHAKRG